MKKIIWFVGIAILVTYTTYAAYFVLMPRVVVENISGESIKLVEVNLPSNKLVFDAMAEASTHTIYYSLNQGDGVYKYRVVYMDGQIRTGECGYVSANEYFKSFRFVLRPNRVVTCNR